MAWESSCTDLRIIYWCLRHHPCFGPNNNIKSLGAIYHSLAAFESTHLDLHPGNDGRILSNERQGGGRERRVGGRSSAI